MLLRLLLRCCVLLLNISLFGIIMRNEVGLTSFHGVSDCGGPIFLDIASCPFLRTFSACLLVALQLEAALGVLSA